MSRTLFSTIALAAAVASCSPVAPAGAPPTTPPPAASPIASEAKPAAPPPHNDNAERTAALHSALEALRKEVGVIGMSVAVVDHGEVVLLHGFGTTELDGAAAVTEDTPFYIASITKTFTGMLAAIAVDDGVLSFDDSPRKFVPNFHLSGAESDAQVTMRDLLSHRSGLPGYVPDEVNDYGTLTFDDYVKLLAQVKLTGKLGEKFQYSNAAFGVAGEAIARAEKGHYADVVRDRLLLPLGMGSSAIVTPATPGARELLVPGYSCDGVHPAVRDGVALESVLTAPAGAMRTTARDMAQWMRLLLGKGSVDGKTIVHEKTFAELMKPQIRDSEELSIGLSFWLGTWRDHRVASHNGGNEGTIASMALLPDDGIGVIVMSNTDLGAHNTSFVHKVWDLAFEALLPGVPRPSSRTATARESDAPKAWKPLPPGSPTIETVMTRTITALGGEKNLRKHHSRATIEETHRAIDGVVVETELRAQPPAMYLRTNTIVVGGHRLGKSSYWFDGKDGYKRNGHLLNRPAKYTETAILGEREEHDFYSPLTWRTLWKEVSLKGVADVAGEPAYVVEKTSSAGFSVLDFISQKTSLLLRRETDDGTTSYSDWRWVDGERIPFARVSPEQGADSTTHVREVRFNVPTTDEMFRPVHADMAPAAASAR